jgi:argininosuccinate lyase
MEALIADGVPQRTAHETVGRLVRQAMTKGAQLAELSDEECRETFADWKPGFRAALGASRAVARMQSVGSTAPGLVTEQLTAWKARLN